MGGCEQVNRYLSGHDLLLVNIYSECCSCGPRIRVKYFANVLSWHLATPTKFSEDISGTHLLISKDFQAPMPRLNPVELFFLAVVIQAWSGNPGLGIKNEQTIDYMYTTYFRE